MRSDTPSASSPPDAPTSPQSSSCARWRGPRPFRFVLGPCQAGTFSTPYHDPIVASVLCTPYYTGQYLSGCDRPTSPSSARPHRADQMPLSIVQSVPAVRVSLTLDP